MPGRSRLHERRALWVGFGAVLVPLVVLLAMQYKWLARLEKTSAIAEKAWLSNYLEAVSSEVEYFYRTQAERGLNLAEGVVSCNCPDKVAHHFLKKQIEGAKYLFVYYQPADPDQAETMTFFDPARGLLGTPDDPATLRAIYVAVAPWRTLLKKDRQLSAHALAVDERDPDNRIILNPISDDSCTAVGVAGMVVDNAYFGERVLPAAIEHALPKFFDDRARRNLAIAVNDAHGKLVLGAAPADKRSQEVARSIDFIFSDWKLILGTRFTTPDEWAKSNFLLNISFSVLLAVVLLGGIVLALRTASREMHLSRMKSEFVSNVSHELRTPLASIRVFGEFLRLGRVEQRDKIREYGEFIETESRRLTQLIDNILDFSKIESGAKTYRFEHVDLGEVIADTLRSIQVSLRHRGFQLAFDPPATPLPEVEVDPAAMAQAVANLVDNAVKYSNGSTNVKVRLERSGSEAVISVEDQGIGISPGEQDKIFERFHRVSTGLRHDVKGSGLGLSIVSHVVQAHRGRVRVLSEPGRGSTFFIYLPLGATVQPEAAPLTAAQAGGV